MTNINPSKNQNYFSEFVKTLKSYNYTHKKTDNKTGDNGSTRNNKEITLDAPSTDPPIDNINATDNKDPTPTPYSC